MREKERDRTGEKSFDARRVTVPKQGIDWGGFSIAEKMVGKPRV